MTSAAPARHASSAAPRHHPYAGPSTSSSAAASGSSSSSSSSSSSKDARKAHRASPSHKDDVAASGSRMPPSPPRSNRDLSEAPSLGLNVAFGSNGGSKWWDEELPAPPASLTSILDSFRKSGEGDRELLLSILGAKKAEEERLTALITTRLTVLQARLSLHSAAAAALQSATPSPMPPVHPLPPQHPGQHLAVPGGSTSSSSSPRLGPSSPHHLPPYGVGAAPSSGPMRPSRSHSPPPHTFPYSAAATHHHAHHHHRSQSRVELPALSLPGDRTPSLTSRGSDASSIGAVSPSSDHGKYNPLDDPRAIGQAAAAVNGGSASAKVANPDLDRYRAAVQPASSSVGTTSFWRRSPEGDDVSASVSLPPIRPRVTSGSKKDEDVVDRNASLSPKSAAEGRSFNGIDMLLDAGRRAVM